MRWYRYLLVVVMITAVVVAGFVGWKRYRSEVGNRQVALTVEFGEAKMLAARTGLPFGAVLQQLQSQGVTGVFFKEELLADLEQGGVWVRSGSELLADPDFQAYRGQLRANNTYLLTLDPLLYRRLEQQLTLKIPSFTALGRSSVGTYLIGVPMPVNALANIGLGFSQGTVTQVAEMGLDVFVQVRSWPEATEPALAGMLASLASYPNLKAIAFNEKVIPGYPDQLPALVTGLKQLQVPVVSIEFYNQLGFTQMARELGLNIVRLHTITTQEMSKLSTGEAVSRMVLAATERNARVLLVRLFMQTESSSWLQDNLDYLGQLRTGLIAHDLIPGTPQPFAPFHVPSIAFLILGLGVVAGGMLLCEKLKLHQLALLVGLLGVVGYLGLLIGGHDLLGRKVMAFGATIIFPTLGLTLFLKEKNTVLRRSIWRLLLTSLYSLLGAALVVGLLADVSFMLKLEQFSGVKAAHVLPLLLLLLIFWLGKEQNRWRKVKEFWEANLRVSYATLVVVLAVMVTIYLLRTGNEGMTVSGLELKLRSLFDHYLGVRPRTKEFLVGHPLLLLTFYLGYRHRWLPLLLLGAIGQVSLVNTYTHVHTPLVISFFRTFNGLWLGLLLGIFLILLYEFLAVWGRRIARE